MWDGSVYLSRDLRSWRRVLTPKEYAVFDQLPSSFLVTVRDGFQLALDVDVSASIAYESSDGVRWHRIPRSTTPGVVTGLPAGSPLGAGFVSRKISFGAPVESFRSEDRKHWTRIGVLPPRTIGRMASDRSRRVLYAIQFEPAHDEPGGAIFRTRDGRRWREVTSFSRRFPDGNPDDMVQSGRWWVYGGNEGGLRRRQTMWVTPDLEHWIEMPKPLRAAGPSGVSVVAHGKTVVGYLYSIAGPGSLWIWHRPARIPELVRVSGVVRSAGGPSGTGSIVDAVRVFRGTELVDEVAVAADGAYALDLPPGRYELRTACQRMPITVRTTPIRWSDVCSIR